MTAPLTEEEMAELERKYLMGDPEYLLTEDVARIPPLLAELRALRAEKAALQHGTMSGYQHFKCRCDDCREANTTYMRNYWRRRKDVPQP